MTNKERQKALDKKKWLESEKRKKDVSGLMTYCGYCEEQGFNRDNLIPCNINQVERESNCTCAKAYNRMVRGKQ
jgi:hypothetical protein